MSTRDYEKMSLIEQIKTGLEQSIAHTRGELTLRTTTLPAPPPPATPKRVSRLRKKLRLSQSVFAAALNVSPKLVQSWEQGLRKPDRSALRLLQIVEEHPELIQKFLGKPPRVPARRRRAA